MRYSVVLTVAAAEDFRRIDGSLKEPVAKQLRKLETAPQLGEHLGNRAGLDLTGISAGKRPGTQVFTVNSGTLGVPTLVIQTER